MTAKRILVTGSRDWDDWTTLSNALSAEYEHRNTIVVHGDCPTGADRMANGWCFLLDIEPERHPAQWKVLGRSAGPIRNTEMVALGADVCLAFIKNNSRGASGCAEMARQAGIPVKVWKA